MSQFSKSSPMRRPPYITALVIVAVLIAVLVALSMVDSSKVPQRVEKQIPENALAK